SGKVALVLFDSPAAERVFIQYSSSTGGGSNIYLLAPDGSQLAGTCANCVYAPNQIGTIRLSLPGTYALFWYPGNPTVSFTFYIYEVPPDPTAAIQTDGQPVTITTTTPGQDARFTFNGTGGQKISMNWDSGGLDRISILKPDGSELAGQCTGCGGFAF